MPLNNGIFFHEHGQNWAGDNTPVVLIHGAGGNSLSWPVQLRRFDSRHILAVDLPGHGKSEGHGYQNVGLYALAVEKWLLDVKVVNGIFIGHSMGSAVALQICLDFPEIVKGLVLVGSSARLRVSRVLLESVSQPSTYPRAVDLIGEWSFSANTPKRLVELSAKRLMETRASVLHADLLACNVFDINSRLQEIQCPTLIICGEQDRMTPPRDAHHLASGIQNSFLQIIPECGHMVVLENPQAVAELILQFVTLNL